MTPDAQVGTLSDHDRLLRYGQMYIGERIPDRLAGWKTARLDRSLRLATHPRLNVTQVGRGPHELTLVGSMIDPENPERGDAEILEELVSVPGFADSPFDKTDRFGGRWLLVLGGPEDTIAFADPGGLRQLFYAWDGGTGAFHFASEPGLLGELGGLELDPEAEAFRASPGFIRNEEYWWPGDSSPFAEVRCLLPSFFMSLRTGRCKRFWPTGPLGSGDPEKVIELVAHRLPAMMRGIARRGNTEVSITAGLDSRMVLAASRDLIDELRFVTVQQPGMPASHADLEIPRRLAGRLGFGHRILVSAGDVREGFRSAYRDGILFFHEKWLHDAQALFDAYGQEPAFVVGSMGEAARVFYGRHLTPGSQPRAERLVQAAKLGAHPFALRHFQAWLDTVERPYDLSVGDLFYVEQRAGRWLATSQLEFGQVWRDIFAPFNSREIVSSLLTVPAGLRREPESLLFKDLIARMWPEALSEPINPHKLKVRVHPLARLAKRAKRWIGRYVG
jgi:hypothetical protein